tara:strand:- start:1007 stop:1555 length:549 start_codon:yes stop_codon:yes gene_type:complete
MLDSILADRDLVVDWVKFSTMFVVSRLLAGGDLGDQEWMMGCLYTLLGFTAYHMVTKKLIPNNLEHEAMKRVLDTWLKVGTMLTASRLLSGKPLNEQWMMSSLFTILGFNAMDAVVKDLVPLDNVESDVMKAVITDALTVATMTSVSTLLGGGEINEQVMTSGLYTFLGFAAYDVGTSKLLN